MIRGLGHKKVWEPFINSFKKYPFYLMKKVYVSYLHVYYFRFCSKLLLSMEVCSTEGMSRGQISSECLRKPNNGNQICELERTQTQTVSNIFRMLCFDKTFNNPYSLDFTFMIWNKTIWNTNFHIKYMFILDEDNKSKQHKWTNYAIIRHFYTYLSHVFPNDTSKKWLIKFHYDYNLSITSIENRVLKKRSYGNTHYFIISPRLRLVIYEAPELRYSPVASCERLIHQHCNISFKPFKLWKCSTLHTIVRQKIFDSLLTLE